VRHLTVAHTSRCEWLQATFSRQQLCTQSTGRTMFTGQHTIARIWCGAAAPMYSCTALRSLYIQRHTARWHRERHFALWISNVITAPHSAEPNAPVDIMWQRAALNALQRLRACSPLNAMSWHTLGCARWVSNDSTLQFEARAAAFEGDRHRPRVHAKVCFLHPQHLPRPCLLELA
jgi:hypothetical protein